MQLQATQSYELGLDQKKSQELCRLNAHTKLIEFGCETTNEQTSQPTNHWDTLYLQACPQQRRVCKFGLMALSGAAAGGAGSYDCDAVVVRAVGEYCTRKGVNVQAITEHDALRNFAPVANSYGTTKSRRIAR
jgi:hypothetical protein